MGTVASENAGSRRFSARGVAFLVLGALITFALGFLTAVLIWVNAGGGVWRSEVGVAEALLRAPTELLLSVRSCNGNPELILLQESDAEVQVKVIASSTPLLGGDDCLDALEVQLRDPLGNRTVIDKHTGQTVSVRRFN